MLLFDNTTIKIKKNKCLQFFSGKRSFKNKRKNKTNLYFNYDSQELLHMKSNVDLVAYVLVRESTPWIFPHIYYTYI